MGLPPDHISAFSKEEVEDYFGYGKELKINFGASIMKTLQQVENRRFYLFTGYGFYHNEQKIWQSNYQSMDDGWVAE
ncbi:MAG: hypothetical protein K9M99_13040 [Candidatus Cloacimonetes bacterium]|nr:hypothetical protein [Candidatus Cloacimonadota bacterium]